MATEGPQKPPESAWLMVGPVGVVVLPEDLRERLGIDDGDMVLFRIYPPRRLGPVELAEFIAREEGY